MANDALRVAVTIPTVRRPEQCRRLVEAVLNQKLPDDWKLRIIVVDNDPDGSHLDLPHDARLEVLHETEPGVPFARNRGIEEALLWAHVVAFIDDDEVADPYWLSEIARALAEHPEADVVSGVIVPAELETLPQLWFEQFGGHSKGRGFAPDVFSPGTMRGQSPLYPLPPFGAGGNMTFRPGVIERIGGFDTALGSGTPALGSEDTLAFMQVLRRGGTVVYQPTAVVRHRHHRDLAGLRRQLVGYGAGLTAAYTSLVRSDPRVLVPLLRLVPTALRDLFGGDGLREASLAADFPRELLRDNRRGMLRGPVNYLRGRWRLRHRREAAG
jgi:GT2 family glycosyltransferase